MTPLLEPPTRDSGAKCLRDMQASIPPTQPPAANRPHRRQSSKRQDEIEDDAISRVPVLEVGAFEVGQRNGTLGFRVAGGGSSSGFVDKVVEFIEYGGVGDFDALQLREQAEQEHQRKVLGARFDAPLPQLPVELLVPKRGLKVRERGVKELHVAKRDANWPGCFRIRRWVM